MLLLAITAFWVAREAENTLENNLASKLLTILQIESEAIKDWLESQQELATLFAQAEPLAAAVAKFNSHPDHQATTNLLSAELDRSAAQLGGTDCMLISIDGSIQATSSNATLIEQLPSLEDLFRHLHLQEQATILPPIRVPHDRSSEFGADRIHSSLMIVVAPIRDSSNRMSGFLGVRIRPLKAFSRILKSSRTGRTGETFVFDVDGSQLSALRFPTADAAKDPVQHDSLVRQIVRSSASFPQKIHQDLSGYPDYRGDLAIGVGKWLPQFGFGIVTKMNRSEAKAPIVQIRRFLWILTGLLLVSMAFTFFYRWYIFRLDRAACAEELRRKQLGPYVLEEKIGEGGMGEVYRAKHALLRRPTAVKILPPEKSSSKAIARFEQEVHLTSQLKHPNTISIYDFGRTKNGLFFYAMEYLDGIDLEDLVRRDGQIPASRVIHILVQVCASLREAHQEGLVHRDIKPANIMLCNRGGAVDTVKVLDFGMVRDQRSSRDNHEGGLSGTPLYMAPEAFTDPAGVDRRADIFAVGAVGFFLLTGQTLFESTTFQEVIKHHRSGRNFDIETRLQQIEENGQSVWDKGLVQVISRCLATNPQDRFQNVNFLKNELNRCTSAGLWNEVLAVNWWNNFCPAALSEVFEARPPNELAETLAMVDR